jgi:hypothetical protein
MLANWSSTALATRSQVGPSRLQRLFSFLTLPVLVLRCGGANGRRNTVSHTTIGNTDSAADACADSKALACANAASDAQEKLDAEPSCRAATVARADTRSSRSHRRDSQSHANPHSADRNANADSEAFACANTASINCADPCAVAASDACADTVTDAPPVTCAHT